MADIRINDLPETLTPSASDNVAIDGATTRRTTAKKLVDAGAPVASQAEAEAGTDAEKRMTPLTTKQSIASEVGVTLASAEQGALAGSAVQPSDIGTTAGTVAAGDDSRIIDAYKSLSESAGTRAARERVSAVAAQNTTALPDEGIGAPLDPPLVPFAATAAKTYEFSEQKTTHGGAFFTKALIKKSSGSGEFGPQSADGALILSAEKVTYTGGTETGDWKTAQGEGEIDTLIVVARQGHKGDTAGIAVDVRKVRTGASGETGGGTPIEIASAIVNESDVPSLSMHWIPGMTETSAGLSAGKGYGSFVETRAGTWFAAYYAGGVGVASPANENPSLGNDGFQYLLLGSKTRNPTGTDVYFAVGGDKDALPGAIYLGSPTERHTIWHNPSNHVLTFYNTSGTIIASLDDLGNFGAAAGVQIRGGSVQQYLKTVSGTFDPPSIAAFATVDLVELDCPGSLPGDMVTACCTSTLGVFASLQLTGVVYSANKVTLRGRNTTNAAVDYANFPYTIKVERFVA